MFCFDFVSISLTTKSEKYVLNVNFRHNDSSVRDKRVVSFAYKKDYNLWEIELFLEIRV